MVIIGLVSLVVLLMSMTTDVCVCAQVSILMLQAANCVYAREANRFQIADSNTKKLKYINHGYATSI